MTRILVIKLGALGDFIQALGPMAAIRRHHPNARITLLTTPPLQALAEACPHVDEVWLDDRPGLGRPASLLRLRRKLREARFERVYDLQTSDRSSWYFQLLRPGRRPEWSGIARGASHPDGDPERDRRHTIERQRGQLAAAGIAVVPPPELSWLVADTSRFRLAKRHALIVPGAAPHRPEKRWPAGNFAEIARRYALDFIQPVIVGGPAERELGRQIAMAVPEALDLTGETSLGELASLGRSALSAVGNDTGPMHLLAAAGTPVVVLFSGASDPELTSPRGRRVQILRRDSLADLTVPEVAAALRLR
jgi:ADP-heptose:LPS heptosyltransferase